MEKFICVLILSGMQACIAQDLTGKLQLSVATGYRQEHLRWSIAGNADGGNPNILSELRWKNIGGPVAEAHMGFRVLDHWQLEGEYERMFFLSGKVYDTDYGGDDRTNIAYAAQFHANKGGLHRWLAGLANQIPLTSEFSITPSAGYGILYQSFYLLGNTAAFSDLNSTYKTKWAGAYGQVLCSALVTKKLSMNAALRYSQVKYRASANWNLIREFSHPESFRHSANGYGINAHASLLYHASDLHSIGIRGSYSCWQTGRGIDELYFAAGGSQQTQLNEVRSKGWQVMVEWRVGLELLR
jgi:hypothetical protein